MTTLADLLRASPDQLERIYAGAAPMAVPTGSYNAHHLGWTDIGSCSPWRPLVTVGFKWSPFGIDFDRRLWFFWHESVALGRFEPRVGRSRWRETETIGLHYFPSRLPRLVKGALYDEVKPLAPGLCLGIGGLNAPRGKGDLFYFALERG